MGQGHPPWEAPVPCPELKTGQLHSGRRLPGRQGDGLCSSHALPAHARDHQAAKELGPPDAAHRQGLQLQKVISVPGAGCRR